MPFDFPSLPLRAVTVAGRIQNNRVVTVAPAHFAFDMLGAILEVVTAEMGMQADSAILILTRFETEVVSVDAALLFLPDPDSLDVLLGRLGIV